MAHVRILYKLGLIKQETDMSDNEGNDLDKWLAQKESKAFKHFIQPQITGKMSDQAVNALISRIADEIGTSLWLVWKVEIEPRLNRRELPNPRLGSASRSTTRSVGAKAQIVSAARASKARATKARATKSPLDDEFGDSFGDESSASSSGDEWTPSDNE